MGDQKPLIVMSASPHAAADPHIPPTTKRRELCQFLFENRDILKNNFRLKSTRGFHLWTHGGYKNDPQEDKYAEVYEEVQHWDFESAAYGGQFGGVVELANEVVSERSKVVLFFISISDQRGVHSPANQALARICDYKNVPIYFNSTSALFWVRCLNVGAVNPKDYLPGNDEVKEQAGALGKTIPPPRVPKPLSLEEALKRYGPDTPISKRTLALISHDEYKESMRDFVLFFERTLQRFKRIIATGTTGTGILELVPSLRAKLLRYESGPKGGDIRIAYEILAGTCHDVVFFMDPLRAHPHASDIRMLTMACNQTGANLITNRTAAKDWIAMLSRNP